VISNSTAMVKSRKSAIGYAAVRPTTTPSSPSQASMPRATTDQASATIEPVISTLSMSRAIWSRRAEVGTGRGRA
jgi:hypothetical protein